MSQGPSPFTPGIDLYRRAYRLARDAAAEKARDGRLNSERDLALLRAWVERRYQGRERDRALRVILDAVEDVGEGRRPWW